MHRKRVVLTGFGLLLTGAMLLSSCAFFKKTISDLSDLDAKTAEADSAAQGDTKDPGASDPENADNASDTAEKQEPSAAKDTASDAPAAASVKDAIVGSWSVDHLEDADGNTVGCCTDQRHGAAQFRNPEKSHALHNIFRCKPHTGLKGSSGLYVRKILHL